MKIWNSGTGRSRIARGIGAVGLSASMVFAATACASGGSTAEEGSLVKFAVGVPSPNLSFFPLYVGQKEGQFADAGLDVDLLAVTVGSTGMAALESGSLDAYAGLLDSAVSAIAAGGNYSVISAVKTQNDYTIVAQPEIANVEDLKGKKIAVQGPGNGTELQTKWLLDEIGVGSDSATYVAVGGSSDRIAALLAGQVDATITFAPGNFEAVSAGMHIIAEMSDYIEDFPGVVLTAGDRQLESDGERMSDFLHAMYASSQWIYDNPVEALELAKETLGWDPEIVEEAFAQYLEHKWWATAENAVVDERVVQFAVDLANTYSDDQISVTADDVLDMTHISSR